MVEYIVSARCGGDRGSPNGHGVGGYCVGCSVIHCEGLYINSSVPVGSEGYRVLLKRPPGREGLVVSDIHDVRCGYDIIIVIEPSTEDVASIGRYGKLPVCRTEDHGLRGGIDSPSVSIECHRVGVPHPFSVEYLVLSTYNDGLISDLRCVLCRSEPAVERVSRPGRYGKLSVGQIDRHVLALRRYRRIFTSDEIDRRHVPIDLDHTWERTVPLDRIIVFHVPLNERCSLVFQDCLSRHTVITASDYGYDNYRNHRNCDDDSYDHCNDLVHQIPPLLIRFTSHTTL